MFNKGTAEFTPGYFGKLPEFNDFIKFNAGTPEILTIDNWLQEGLGYAKLKYKSEWKEKYDNLQPTGFFIPNPISGKITAGMLYAGKDKSGREFPFLIYLLLHKNNFDEYYSIPAVFQPVLLMLEELLRKEKDIYALNNILRNYKITLPQKESLKNKFNDYLSDTLTNDFLNRTKLNKTILDIKNLMYSDSTFIRIMFTSDDVHFSFDAGLLIYLLSRKINLSLHRSSLFWNKNDDNQFLLTIFPFNLTALNFIDLLSINTNDNRIINIVSGEISEGNKNFENNLSLKEIIKSV